MRNNFFISFFCRLRGGVHCFFSVAGPDRVNRPHVSLSPCRFDSAKIRPVTTRFQIIRPFHLAPRPLSRNSFPRSVPFPQSHSAPYPPLCKYRETFLSLFLLSSLLVVPASTEKNTCMPSLQSMQVPKSFASRLRQNPSAHHISRASFQPRPISAAPHISCALYQPHLISAAPQSFIAISAAKSKIFVFCGELQRAIPANAKSFSEPPLMQGFSPPIRPAQSPNFLAMSAGIALL